MNLSQTALARMVRKSAEDLGKAATELGDKMTWRPLDKGRSALDQVQECAGIALLGTQILTTQAMPPMDPSTFEKLRADHDTPAKALQLLSEAADQCARAIETFPDDKMDHKITLPFGGGMEKSFAEIPLMVYWNTVYHEGQVNYIQTLTVSD